MTRDAAAASRHAQGNVRRRNRRGRELSFIAAKQWAKGDLERVRELIAQHKLNAERIFTHQHTVEEDITAAYLQAFTDPDCLKMILLWKSGINLEAYPITAQS